MAVRNNLGETSNLSYSIGELIAFLQEIQEKKLHEIEKIENKIIKYEEDRRAEEAFYQSLSPIRRFFASRAPSHHLAVEYMVHVKGRKKQIEALNKIISEVDTALFQLKKDPQNQKRILSNPVIEEFIRNEAGGYKYDC